MQKIIIIRDQGPLLLIWIDLILEWISSKPSKPWDEITYPCYQWGMD